MPATRTLPLLVVVATAWTLVAAASATAPSNAGGRGDQEYRRLAGWASPAPVSPKDSSTNSRPSIVLDRFGNTIVAWIGTGEDTDLARGLIVRRMPAGSGWQAPQFIDRSGAVTVDMSADAAGTVTVVYGRARGDSAYRNSLPYAMTSDPSGQFTAPVQLSADGPIEGDIRLVVGPDGTATAAWMVRLKERVIRIAVARRPPGKDWQPIEYISPADTRAVDLEIAVGPDGDVHAMWISRRLHQHHEKRTVHARTLSKGHWSSPSTLTHRHKIYADDLELAAGPGGTALAAWVYWRNVGHYVQVTASRKPDGAWTRPRQIPGAAGYDAAKVAMALGREVMVYTTPDPHSVTFPESSHMMARIRRNGTWGEPVMLSNPGGSPAPAALTADAKGRLRLVWTYQKPPEFVIPKDTSLQTRLLRLDGAWSPTSTIARPNVFYDSVDLALGADRGPAVVWKQLDRVTYGGRVYVSQNVEPPGACADEDTTC